MLVTELLKAIYHIAVYKTMRDFATFLSQHGKCINFSVKITPINFFFFLKRKKQKRKIPPTMVVENNPISCALH